MLLHDLTKENNLIKENVIVVVISEKQNTFFSKYL